MPHTLRLLGWLWGVTSTQPIAFNDRQIGLRDGRVAKCNAQDDHQAHDEVALPCLEGKEANPLGELRQAVDVAKGKAGEPETIGGQRQQTADQPEGGSGTPWNGKEPENGVDAQHRTNSHPHRARQTDKPSTRCCGADLGESCWQLGA